MMKEFDNYQESFTKMEDLIDCMERRENNIRRIVPRAMDIKFFNTDYCKRFYKTEKAIAEKMNVSEEVVNDTIENTDIILTIGDENGDREPFLLGGSSWISLKNRIQIYGNGFDMLDSGRQSMVMNKRFSQIGEKTVQVMVIDSKVRAVMSDEYAVVPAADLFKAVIKAVEDRFDSYEMVGGYVDHSVYRAKILLPDMKDDLNSMYQLPDTYIPGIVIETSDTGYSANKIGTYWEMNGGGSFINQNEYIYMMHKGATSLDKVMDEVPNLFLKYQNTVRKFSKLMTVVIDNPVTTLKKACKQLGISNKLVKQLSEKFEAKISTTQVDITAYDICREIFTLPALVDDKQKTLMQEKVGKAININYADLSADV